MKYFVLAKNPKPKKLVKEKLRKEVKEKTGLPPKETIRISISGKLAAVRDIRDNIRTISKPTKQIIKFSEWLDVYEKELYAEWNTINRE